MTSKKRMRGKIEPKLGEKEIKEMEKPIIERC